MRSLLKYLLASLVLPLLAASLLLAEDTHPAPSANLSTQKPSTPQTTCPVMGGTIGPIDKALYVDVKGKRIYICCAACESAIRTDPDMYIKKIEKRGETVADSPPEATTDADNKKARD